MTFLRPTRRDIATHFRVRTRELVGLRATVNLFAVATLREKERKIESNKFYCGLSNKSK